MFPIRVPPLRERREDIPIFIAFFVTVLAKKLGKALEGFNRASMERLLAYHWPGNVRELQNVVERAAILAQGPVIDLDRDLLEPPPAGSPDRTADTLEDVERQHILNVLTQTGWVIEGAVARPACWVFIRTHCAAG